MTTSLSKSGALGTLASGSTRRPSNAGPATAAITAQTASHVQLSQDLADTTMLPLLQGCQEEVVNYANQVVVNAHLMLANLGSDAYVLNVDLDDFLVIDNRTTLPELFDGCFKNQTANVPRCASWPGSSSASGGVQSR